MRSILSFCLLFVFQLAVLHGQPLKWKNVAPHILQTANGGTPPVEFGAIAAKQNTIFAGWSNLALSTDGGATWTTQTFVLSPVNFVTDVAVFDDHTIAFMSARRGAYLSTDAGNSWKNIDADADGVSITFDGAPTRLAMTHQSNAGYYYNAGAITHFTLPIPYGSTIRRAADGSLRILGGNPSMGWLFSSSDQGVSWMQSQAFSSQVDDYSFIPDQTDPNRFVLVNENWISRIGGMSTLFLTPDNGITLNTVNAQPLGNFTYFSGNSAAGCHDYFVGTINNGLLRSSDKGLSWQSIGGPGTAVDSRSIAASDDSLIVAIDTLGSIWATDVSPRDYGPAKVLGGEFFKNLIIPSCDTTIVAPIYFTNNSCTRFNIVKMELTGKDAAQYGIIGSVSSPTEYPDSIHIRFNPQKNGVTDAQLNITFQYGSVAIVDLSVTVVPVQLSFSKPSLFPNDTIFICGTPSDTLVMNSSCATSFASVSVQGKDSLSFQLKSKKTGSLPADSLIIISCSPKRLGSLSAALHIVMHDGRTFDTPINVAVDTTPITVKPASLFTNDTILLCASDTALLHLNAPCPLIISLLTFTGADNQSFVIPGKNSAFLPNDSVIKIICFPQHEGTLTSNLHILAKDGRMFDVPVSLVVNPCSLAVYPSRLFSGDTILLCQADSAIIHFAAQSGLDITSLTITGPDSASFDLHGKTTVSLPGDSMVKVYCVPLHEGVLEATIHITASDGRSWDLPMNLVVLPTPLVFFPHQLFDGDTVITCSSDSAEVTFSAPCPFTITSISLTGPDASSFHLSGKNTISLPGDSQLRIICDPQHSGDLSAMAEVHSDDGRTWNIPLSGFAYTPPLTIRNTTLFSGDTIAYCSSVSDSVIINSLCPQDLSSFSVTGTDSLSFVLESSSPLHLPGDSVIRILCLPQREGRLNAQLHIVSPSGKTWDIPLPVEITGRASLSFGSVQDGFTTVVGGDVTIPIHFLSSGEGIHASFTIRYDTASLVFAGVFPASSVSDLTAGHPDSRSAQVNFSISDTPLIAKFFFFPVDSNCTGVIFDSLTSSEAGNCLNVLSSVLSASICSPAECSRTDLARFLKYGSVPHITLSPNPSSGAVTISSSLPVGRSRFSISDNLGREILYFIDELSPAHPLKLNLDRIPSGQYFLHISGSSTVSTFVVFK